MDLVAGFDETQFKKFMSVFNTKAVARQKAAEGEEEAEKEAARQEAEIKSLHAELHSVYTSRSWIYTKPLRWAMFQKRLLKQKAGQAKSKK